MKGTIMSSNLYKTINKRSNMNNNKYYFNHVNFFN